MTDAQVQAAAWRLAHALLTAAAYGGPVRLLDLVNAELVDAPAHKRGHLMGLALVAATHTHARTLRDLAEGGGLDDLDDHLAARARDRELVLDLLAAEDS